MFRIVCQHILSLLEICFNMFQYVDLYDTFSSIQISLCHNSVVYMFK